MNRLSVIMIPLLLIMTGTDARADDDPSEITSKTAPSPPNQYPPMTSVGPIDLVNQPSFEGWPMGSSGITGNWGGVRNDLIEHGIHFNGSYSALMFDNFQGGFDTGFFGGGITQLELTVETEKAIDIEGGLFFMNVAQMTWYNGRFEPPGSFSPTGSVIGEDANFPPGDQSGTLQMNQCFWRQSLAKNALQIAFGKIDANVTFAAIDAAGGFQNGLGAVPTPLNEFLPTFPNPAMGLQIDVQIDSDVEAHFGWWDGTTAAFNPVTGEIGPPTGDHGVGSFFNNDDHWFLISQVDCSWELGATTPGEISIGGWFQTGTSRTNGDSRTGVDDVPGWYVNLAQTLWSRDETSAAEGGGIQLFGSIGWSPGSKNPNNWSAMAGLSATGVVPGRNSDALGVMVGTTVFSDDPAISQSTMPDGMPGPAGGAETLAEVFYRIQLTPAMMVQPGLEWVVDPGGGSPAQLENALSGYLAIMIEF